MIIGSLRVFILLDCIFVMLYVVDSHFTLKSKDSFSRTVVLIPPFLAQGVYRDPQGHAIDLRPVEGKPCYSTFKNKSPVELYELLITALENQLVELRKSPYTNTEKETLKKIENNLALVS